MVVGLDHLDVHRRHLVRRCHRLNDGELANPGASVGTPPARGWRAAWYRDANATGACGARDMAGIFGDDVPT